jgi:hypothetical protein
VEPVFSPLDEELALLPGSLFPRQQEGLVWLSSWMRFGKAAQLPQDLLGVSCSKATAQDECHDCDGKQACSRVFSPIGRLSLAEKLGNGECGGESQEYHPVINASVNFYRRINIPQNRS